MTTRSYLDLLGFAVICLQKTCPQNCAHGAPFSLKKIAFANSLKKKKSNEIDILTEIIGSNKMVVFELEIPCSIHY